MIFTKIILTQGKVALVDAKNHFRLAMNKWRYNNQGYAVRNENGKIILMHRLILEWKLGHSNFEECDHENHNGIDNEEENLRPATHAQNAQNRRKLSNATSKYKGVSWHKVANKWQAYIVVNKELIYLGLFDIEIDAARAYNTAAKEYFGEFACLNFPEENYK